MIKNTLASFIKSIRHNKILQIAFVVVFILVAAIIMINFNFTETKAFIRANRGQAALISIGIYFLLGFTFIPASPLTLFLAVFMGPWETVLVATTGNTLAAMLEYQIGYSMGDIFDFKDQISKLPFGLANLSFTSIYLLLAGRLLPLGKRGFSIVCGAYHVPIGKYTWTTVLMYIFNASLLAFTGTSLVRFIENLVYSV